MNLEKLKVFFNISFSEWCLHKLKHWIMKMECIDYNNGWKSMIIDYGDDKDAGNDEVSEFHEWPPGLPM